MFSPETFYDLIGRPDGAIVTEPGPFPFATAGDVMTYEVTGTTRNPDGVTSGRIDGLVVRSGVQVSLIDLGEAIGRARAWLLWARVPGDGKQVRVVAVDTNGDGWDDAVKTEADDTWRNNLLALPIWDRTRGQWVYPESTGLSALFLSAGRW